MNKYQEALNKLTPNDWDIVHHKDGWWSGQIKAVTLIQELVDKATPRKPKRKLIKSEDLWSETVTVIGIDICDNCKEHVQHSRKFCDKCGQALDWSRDDYPHR